MFLNCEQNTCILKKDKKEIFTSLKIKKPFYSNINCHKTNKLKLLRDAGELKETLPHRLPIIHSVSLKLLDHNICLRAVLALLDSRGAEKLDDQRGGLFLLAGFIAFFR